MEALKEHGKSEVVSDKYAHYEEEQHEEHYASLQKEENNHKQDVVDTTESMTDHGHDDNNEHDHTKDHGDSSSLISFVGKFHPVVIHFPIALIVVALLFTIIAILFKAPQYDVFSIKLVYVALLSAIVSVLFGLAAGSGAEYPSFLIKYFDWHKIFGLTSTVIMVFTALFAYRFEKNKSIRRAWVYRSVLFF